MLEPDSAKPDELRSTTTIGELLGDAAAELRALPQASPRLEAELLLAAASGLDRCRLLAWPEAVIEAGALARFHALLERRLAGEPIAYIRGHQEFWSQTLRVTPDTLIPRPETELLVELALEGLPANESLLVLDAGCGSGAIAAALASERPAWTLIAVDLSEAAAHVARENFHSCSLGNTAVLTCDWLTPIATRCLHAIVANPPYIPGTDPHLRQGDLPWEPRGALAAGPDGLDAIRVLSAQAASRLRPAGFFALEHGFDQGAAVRSILAGEGFERLTTHPDLSGRDRATIGRLVG
jgi:release factor glutamine methyltransferase